MNDINRSEARLSFNSRQAAGGGEPSFDTFIRSFISQNLIRLRHLLQAGCQVHGVMAVFGAPRPSEDDALRAGLKPLCENQRISYDVRSELDGRRSAVDLKAV